MAERKDQTQKKKRQRPHLSERWWKRNQDILQHLYEERAIPEIARLVGQSEEQVKTVQEQVENLRKVQLNSADTMLILKYLPHPRVERSPELLERFEKFLKELEEEPQDESVPIIRDASSNPDKYIYG
jgi:hypothetical protein